MTKSQYDNNFLGVLEELEEDRFAKANAASPWENLLTDLGEMFAKAGVYGPQPHEVLRATAVRRTEMGAEWKELFAKALPKSEPKRVIAIKAHPAPAREPDLMAKAVGLLEHDHSLSAHDRGMLMLGISAAHDRSFAKAQRADTHPVAARIEQIRDALKQARAERELPPNAAVYVDEALHHLAQLGSGIVTADDAGRLQHLLMQIKLAMSAADSDALGVGDAR